MIVADASWVIALRDPHDAHHRLAVDSNRKLGTEQMVLPSLTFAECLVAPARMGVLDEAAEDLRAAFDIYDADQDAPLRWAALRASTRLRLPDVIVLDAALTREARGIATFDDRLADRSLMKGLDVIGHPGH